MINSMKESVQLVLLNEENGQVLCVSRKHDHNSFGLIGGKVDNTDISPIDAIIRETKEETGLKIYEKDLTLIFAMHKDGYMGYTYITKYWEGIIDTDEPHVVKWDNFDCLITNSSFGRYNKLVAQSLVDMGVNFKINKDLLD